MNSPTTKRLRLDQLLVRRYGYQTRSRARDAILRGAVCFEGKVLKKPGELVSCDIALSIDDAAARYVSRAALKLVHALKHVDSDRRFSPKGKNAIDIGVSTGGFTQVFLEGGAKHVIAIDVGIDQLHPSLQADDRISLHEKMNARDLDERHLNGLPIEYLVCDASFISLKLVLPPALHLASSHAAGIFLVKPQFEVGRENIGKGGLVKSTEIANASAQAMAQWLDQQTGWQVVDLIPSPVRGGDGNEEFLLFAIKDEK